ncbi:hypothetical protein GTR00_07895 [Kineococcus sp. T90]|nr:hypothetical protein [Kineococcus indalonis]
MPAPQRATGPADLAAARSLRAALRAALTGGGGDGGGGDGGGGDGGGGDGGGGDGGGGDGGGGAGGAGGAPRAAEVLAGFPLHLAPDAAGRLRLRAAGGAGALDAVVEAVAAGVGTGAWGRLKLCASPDCRWAFRDTSRNGGGRWCSMEVCGNRHKTRTYRQRRAG